jgi:ribosomal protein L7/L12
MPGLTPEQVQKIHKQLHDRQLIQAVKIYRDATGVSLAEAKEAVEEMARNEYAKPPAGVRNYDDPVLESKVKSLLSKGKKLDAVKIYRAEYGTSLKDATEAVERMAASMPRERTAAIPYEPAIGSDPFADEDEPGRRRITILGIVLMLALCGMGAILFLYMSTP